MRKNRMMRAASALLVAVLLTTSTISGTFAKYVTEGSGSDTARVAKWGVEVTGIASDLFKESYDETVVTSVVSEKLVAPGTKNDTGVTFGITGTPEVDVNVKFEITKADGTGDPIDVFLKAQNGKYTNWTLAPYDQKFDLDSDYHPVVFTLKDGSTELVTGTIAEIKAYLEAKNGDYDANTNLAEIFGAGNSGIYTLTWAWGFDVDDKADTLLGQIASGEDATDYGTGNVSTSIDFAIAITVTQID